MMTLRALVFFSTLLFSLNSHAQQTTVFDTLYFNKKWELCGKEKQRYFRVSSLQDSLLTIRDHYASGAMQFEGSWVVKDSIQLAIRYSGFCPEAGAVGTARYYHKNGSPSRTVQYLPDGTPCAATGICHTRITEYYHTGVMGAQWEEVAGKEQGTVHMYDPDNGKLSATCEMKDGVPHGKETKYYTNGTIYSVTEYAEGKKHGFHTEYYSYPFKMKYRAQYEHGKMQWREEY